MGFTWIFKNDDYVVSLRKERKRPRDKQSILPKKPRSEPLSKVIPGEHPVKFERAKDLRK